MNGFDVIADTNFLIAIHEGNDFVEPFLDATIAVSVISEIELLRWHKLSSEDARLLRTLLDDCTIFELTSDIRKLAIALKQKVKIKTPDAIIAAAAQYLQIPLITAGHGFKNIPGLNLILV